MRWYFATGKQYDNQFRPHAFYFESNLVSVHPGHLVVEEHCIALAHSHKSESLLGRRCRENCLSRPFEQRFLVAEDRFIIIDAQNDSFRGQIS
jgi:hypothetical protein